MKITIDWIHDTLWIMHAELAKLDGDVREARRLIHAARMEVTDLIVRRRIAQEQEVPRG